MLCNKKNAARKFGQDYWPLNLSKIRPYKVGSNNQLSRRFLVAQKRFATWLDDVTGSEFYGEDLGDFLKAHKRDKQVVFTFTWLFGSPSCLHGHRERVSVPLSVVQEVLFAENLEKTHLYYEVRRSASFDFSQAQRRLVESIEQKQVRRALAKFLVKNGWFGHSFKIYNNSSPYSFFFRTDGVCGGIILHQATHKNKRGEFPKVYYGMHT